MLGSVLENREQRHMSEFNALIGRSRVGWISYELHSHRFEESIIWTGCVVTDKTSVHIV